jgi:uncharacterized membrane protein
VVEHWAEVVVNAPRAQVYLMWEHLEDFPQYMHFVQQVLPLGEHRTHWVAHVVGRHEWDALDEDWIEGRQIGWRSYAGLRNSGRVTFDDAGPGQTRVRVRISYEPPLGVVGDVGESLGAGKTFDHALQRDLDNFAKMVAAAPVGASDPHLSRYLYNPQSAVAEGKTMEHWPHQEVPREFDW